MKILFLFFSHDSTFRKKFLFGKKKTKMTNFEKNKFLSGGPFQNNSKPKTRNTKPNELRTEIQNSLTNKENSKKIQSSVELSPALKKLKKKKNFFTKKLLKGYSKIHELKLVTIGLASPEKIKSWAEKELPNGKIFGEVTNANTFHYRTFKPSKGGLFCERIFGPIKDFECACGKRQRPTALESRKILEHEQTTRYFCPNCDVEYTWSIIRRYQLGYIKLNAPVTHLWYFKTNPSYLSILFDMKRKHLESIIYCTETITIENMLKTAEQHSKFHPSPTELYKNWQKFFSMEEKLQKYYIMNQKKKKTKKQKKTIFRQNCVQKGLVFQKLNWSNFNTEFIEPQMQKKDVLADSKSVESFNSLSDEKTNLFLNIQKQKQKQLFSHLFQKIWKILLQKTYQNALCQISFQQIFSPNLGPMCQLFLLNSSPFSKSKQLQNSMKKNFARSEKPTGIAVIFSKTSFFCKSIHKKKQKTTQSQMIFFPQNLSSTYLETFSKKNQKYQNFANCFIFLKLKHSKKHFPHFGINESQKKTSTFSVLKNCDSQKEYLASQKAETFWNSFYFLFESGSCFLSLKMKKTNFKSLSKKELLFLINIIPLFQKIFLYKNTKIFSLPFSPCCDHSLQMEAQRFFLEPHNKNSTQIQTFLFQTFFVSQKKNKNKMTDWHFFQNFQSFSENKRLNTKSSGIVNQSFKTFQSSPFFFSQNEQSMLPDTQKVFTENHIVPIQCVKNPFVFTFLPKNTNMIKFQTHEEMQKFLFPEKFGEMISHFEKILWYFKQYYEIELSLSFSLFSSLFDSLLSKKNDTGMSPNFLFPFFHSLSQQIAFFEQNSSSISLLNTFPKKDPLQIFRSFKNSEDFKIDQKKQTLNSDTIFDQQNQLNGKFEEFCEKFFENSHVYALFEKLVAEYFYFSLFVIDSGFLVPPKNFSLHFLKTLHTAQHNNKNIGKTELASFQMVPTFQIQNQREEKIENKRSDMNCFFNEALHVFSISGTLNAPQFFLKEAETVQCTQLGKRKENETSFSQMILKVQQLYQFSFFFCSFNIFQKIAENHSIFKKRKSLWSEQNSVSQYSQNIFKLDKSFPILNVKKSNSNSKQYIQIHSPFLQKKRKIGISNKSCVFPVFSVHTGQEKQSLLTNRKTFFQKNQQLQKMKLLPWLSQDPVFLQKLSDSQNQNMGSFLSSESLGKKNFLFAHTTQEKQEHNSYQKIDEKPMFNFSLFFKKKQKLQIQENQNFFKNPVYTVAYNAVWSNDSDWKYFVYYNAFFLQEFEDKPIYEYRSFSRAAQQKNSPFFSRAVQESSFFETLDDSFASFLSMQIDSFQKNFFVGAGILEKFLTEYTSLELRKMTKQHQILLPKINQKIRFLKQMEKTKKDALKIQKYFQKREHIIRRLKFLRKFFRRNSNPSFMILRNIPVLPPDLRPILKLQNQIAASDLNRFYQRIIYRNDRLKKFSKDSATNQSFEMKYAQRLLQEAVDNLIQNGKGGVKAETNSRGQALKSLSEILKGKQGRFRQYLLGKRVDYSGRSVIVVGPQLKLYECGLPKEMALELFLPFLIQYILQSKLAQTVIGAKNLLKKNSTFTFHLLNKVMNNIPVLLNRAPTLHRLGFQAFLPKLIEGRAILLHPMVCPAFNADFDGDQMAVHIPLTVEARTEAWKFMLATNNLMNSATGEPILLPSQDMVLGCYFLTLDYYAKSFAVQLSNTIKNKSFSHSSYKKHSAMLPQSSTASEADTGVLRFLRGETKPHENGLLFQANGQNGKILNFQYFIRQQKSFLLYNTFQEILAAYQRKEIALHTPVWVKWNASVNFGNDSSKPVEIRLQKNGCWELIHPKYTTFFDQKNQKFSQFIRTTTGRILMNFMIHECIESDM